HLLGLIDDDRFEAVQHEMETVSGIQDTLQKSWLGDNSRHAAALEAEGLAPTTRSMTGLDLARRPHVQLDAVLRSLSTLEMWPGDMPEAAILERAQVSIRYGAFIEKEEMEAERHRKAAE